MKIAVTGVFPDMSRESMEDTILSNGGKMSAAVSGKTTFLVAGDFLEDGRPSEESSKYKTARDKNIPIITFDDLMTRITVATAPTTVAGVPKTVTMQQAAAPVMERKPTLSSQQASTQSHSNSAPTNDSHSNQLWVDKYKPESSKHMIGSNELVSKLTSSLKRYTRSLHTRVIIYIYFMLPFYFIFRYSCLFYKD